MSYRLSIQWLVTKTKKYIKGQLQINISKGDKVVTSGLADQLPSNLYIGEVTKVQNDQYGLAKEVRVKTGADLTDLSHVYVAKRDPKTIPDDESRDK